MSDASLLAEDVERIIAKLDAAEHVERVLPLLGKATCAAFEADRVTIYLATPDRTMLLSKFMMGRDAPAELRLPISGDYSVAGYAAFHRRVVNIADAYDEEELRAFDPPVHFLRAIDEEFGYQTRQLLAGPLVAAGDAEDTLGVLELVNTRSGLPFGPDVEGAFSQLCDALAGAFGRRDPRQRPAPRSKYDHLVIDGILAPDELDLAIRQARRKGTGLDYVLANEFQVSEAAIGRALSQFYRLPYEPFDPRRRKPVSALHKLKRSFIEGEGWLPVDEDSERLTVVTPSPERLLNSRIVSEIFPRKAVDYRVCTEPEFARFVEHFYGVEGSSASVNTIIKQMRETDDGPPIARGAEERVEPDSVTVQIVNRLIVEAHNAGASDIHIEPRRENLATRVRFRIDGLLADYTEVPSSYHARVVARLKIMANLDISNRREPQDGKILFRFFYPDKDIELRVATIPTAGGKEDVVLRLLSAGKPVPIGDLGMRPHNLASVKSLIARPHGLFLVCGPTGSGKTTTLHSILGHISNDETKIWTVEDPVEITHDDLRQVQINPKADLTFARAMRAFLRADPDVIMVGEMRDRETVAMGIQASLTGHLVFATLHTNSASESVQRLLDMGMDPFNFADALLGVMAQRLVRRLCPRCKKPRVASEEQIASMLDEYCLDLCGADEIGVSRDALRSEFYAGWARTYAYGNAQFILYQASGCDWCRGTGYRGRIGIHELLVNSAAVKKKILEHAPAADILAAAVREGMTTLKQDGIEKVLAGVTDLAEVRGVCVW